MKAVLVNVMYFIRYWLPVILLCAAIFIQSSHATPDNFPSFAYADKLAHALVYGLLAVLIYRALNSIRGWHGRVRRLVWASLCAATVYGITDEWHQSYVAARHADAGDLVADVAGSIIGSVVYAKRQLRIGRRTGN